MALIETGSSNGTALARPPLAVSAEVAEIEADLEAARARVAASVRALGDEVARRSDWRTWVRAHPTLVVAGALALGFLTGRGLRAASRNDTRRT